MKEKGLSKTKQIIYGLLIAIAVVTAVVVAFSSLLPTFYLKEKKVAVEIGQTFDPVSMIGSIRNIDVSEIDIESNVDTKTIGEYTVTYTYMMKKQTLTVVVEDRDYPVFTVRDGLDYYMSTDFDINNVVLDVTDKTGVVDFTWKATSGGVDIPGQATLELKASDAYGHVTVNTVNVNVIDDIPPVLKLKSFTEKVEAGDSFDPMVFVESASDNYQTPVLTYEITSGTLNKVGKVKATIYATDTAGNVTSAEVSFTTVDTTAPVVSEKTETHIYKMSEKLDPSKYFNIKDNSEKTKTAYEIVSGDIKVVGTITVAVTVSDYYGNSTDAGTISIEVQDDIAPEFKLTHSSYTINLGDVIEPALLIASASDNTGGEVTFSYKVKSGSLQHAGKCVVNIIASDIYGNASTIAATFTVVDKVAPVLYLTKTKATYIIGEEFVLDSFIRSCTDNDEVTSITMNIVSGSMTEINDAVIEIVATDPSGNTTAKRVNLKVKVRLYADFGTEKNVDITGIDGQPYMIMVNRYMGLTTIYGKDENEDYTVPVKAMLCSVGIDSLLEENYGVRSGSGLTDLGVYESNWRSTFHTLFANDGYHKYSYGQYAIRVTGNILLHSVPYYWKQKDALEWKGTLDNLDHEFNKLGTAASMGCVRFSVADIKWIYDNTTNGVHIVIYDDRDNAGPLERPENFIIDPMSEMLADIDPEILKLSGYYKNTYTTNPEASQNPLNWDPTDPDPANPWIAILEAWEQKQKEKAEAEANGETGNENPDNENPDTEKPDTENNN